MDLPKFFPLMACFLFTRAFDLKDAIFLEGQRREIAIQKLEACPETSRKVVSLDFGKATIVDNMMKFNVTMAVRRNVNEGISHSLRVDRCELNKRFEKCLHVHTFVQNDFCQALKINSLWKMTMADFKPKFECPLRKGVYVAKNCTYDMKHILLFLDDHTYLRTTAILQSERNHWKLACTVTEIRLKKKAIDEEI